jgi:hypothetical protein
MKLSSQKIVTGVFALCAFLAATGQTTTTGGGNGSKQFQVLKSAKGAPDLVFGKDLKLTESGGKYVISGSHPDEFSGLDFKTVRGLAPVTVQVGDVKNPVGEKKPVYVELFTPTSHPGEVGEAMTLHDQEVKTITDRVSSQANVTILSCKGPKVCERSCVKDGKEYCCSYRCQS